MKRFDALLTKVHFAKTSSYRELYQSIDRNLAYLDESLIYHYASSSYSGSASSTLYRMVDKYFPDKKKYQSFLSHLLTLPKLVNKPFICVLSARKVKKV